MGRRQGTNEFCPPKFEWSIKTIIFHTKAAMRDDGPHSILQTVESANTMEFKKKSISACSF